MKNIYRVLAVLATAAFVLPDCGCSDGSVGTGGGTNHFDGGPGCVPLDDYCPCQPPPGATFCCCPALPACPADAWPATDANGGGCPDPGDTTAECWLLGRPFLACARPSGILTTSCSAACKINGGICARSEDAMSVETCCAVGPMDPCLAAQ